MATLDPYLMQQILAMRVPESQRTSTQTQTETGKRTTNTQNMTPESLAALEQFIQQLMNGGTPEMQQQAAARRGEVTRTRSMQDSYSKAAAFADAQGLMSQQLRQAMEKGMPTLVRAAEGAGTSANSMRALMTQQLMTQAAEGAAAQGLQAAGQYGNVAVGFGGILERLTQTDPAVLQALVNAFQVSKGAVQNTTENTSGTRTTESKMSNLDALAKLLPLGSLGGSGTRSISAGSPGSFGPGPGHSFPQMAGLTGTPSVGGGAAGTSHIFSQQSPGQNSLPAGYNVDSGRSSGFSTPGAETNFWSDRATSRAVAEMLGNTGSSWSGYGQL